MHIILPAEIKYLDFICKYQYIDLEMKECYITLTPQYNRECIELYFFFPYASLNEIKFENYYISNNRTPTTNYKSIHFMIGGKEMRRNTKFYIKRSKQ